MFQLRLSTVPMRPLMGLTSVELKALEKEFELKIIVFVPRRVVPLDRMNSFCRGVLIYQVDTSLL